VDELPLLRTMPTNVNLHDQAAVTAWLDAATLQMKSIQPALVVVDTLARCFVGGSEKDAKDMGQFVEGCERVRRTLKCSVLVIHHTTKEGDSERGTESLRNASAAMFRTSKTSGLAVTLVCDRMKEVTAPPPQRLTFKRVEFEKPISGLTSSLALDVAVIDRADLLRAAEAVLDEHGPLSQNSLLSHVRKRRVKFDQNEARRLLKQYAASSLTRIGLEGAKYRTVD
jgi:AAA domain-containing protein